MAGASSSAASQVTEEELTLTVKWSGKEYTVRVCGDDSVGELKRRICEVTNVLPKRQKLLYPKIGSKLADDSTLLSSLPLKSSLKMTMIGFVSVFLCLSHTSNSSRKYVNVICLIAIHGESTAGWIFVLFVLFESLCCEFNGVVEHIYPMQFVLLLIPG